MTTTTVWPVNEIIRRRVRDWRRLTGETGHSGARDESFRKDHTSIYTGSHSVFPAPLMEWILLRYGGPQGGKVLDAFAGGPPRGLVSSIMGFEYHGFEIRQEQIDENEVLAKQLKLENIHYYCEDGRFMEAAQGQYDVGVTCPPYYNLEVYSDQHDDMSNSGSYAEFNASMALCANSYWERLLPDAFCCIIVGLFRDKKTKELVDFRSHTVENFREAGFMFHQEVILEKNFASAAKRSSNSWLGKKLVPNHEYMLVFRKPEA